jgi:hypothetical protein
MLRSFALILLFSVPSVGQTSSGNKTKPVLRPLPTFEVKFEPDPKLSVPFEEGVSSAIFSEGCDAGGNPYVRVSRIVPPSSVEVLKFDPKGIVTFETSKIGDIVEPKWVADFVSDSELYMLIEGDTRTEQHTKKLEGGEDEVYWDKKGEARYYIARFDPDGSYKGALKLDLPFRPRHLSGFRFGSFLASGLDEGNLPHVALLGSGGQLLRFIEFPKEKQTVAEKTVEGSFGVDASPEFASIMLAGFTSFSQYQDDVLYIRGRSGAPIYEIGAGGEAKEVKIKSPEGYSVEYLLPSDRNWFVVSTERGKYTDAKSVIYEVNPSTGEFLGRYLAEGSGRSKSVSEGQSDLACVHDGVFISVRHEDGKLTVLRGSVVPVKERAHPVPDGLR